jgi:hypothetical protein
MEIKCSGSKRYGFDLTHRELLKLTAATGGALAAGRLLPGAVPPAAAHGRVRTSLPNKRRALHLLRTGELCTISSSD